MLEGAVVAEHLEGEPPVRSSSPAILIARLALHAVATALWLALSSALWLPYLTLMAIYGRAPNVPRLRQVICYLGYTWRVEPQAPGLSPLERCWLTLSVLRLVATTPLYGLAWLIDEVL